MRNTISNAIALIACAVFIATPSANDLSACVVPHVQTAAEITREAEVILLVKVPDVTIEDTSPIQMSVLEVLKGEFKEKTVTVRGQTAYYWGSNEHHVPYDFVRLGGRLGNCFADDYRPGGEFLLFLKNGELQWSPLAAVNEEVWGSSDPWLVWVRSYLKSLHL